MLRASMRGVAAPWRVIGQDVEELHRDQPGHDLIDPDTSLAILLILNPRTCGSLCSGLSLSHGQCSVALDPLEGSPLQQINYGVERPFITLRIQHTQNISFSTLGQ